VECAARKGVCLDVRGDGAPDKGACATGRIAVGEQTLHFPESACKDPEIFDQLVELMQEGAVADQPKATFAAALKRLEALDQKAIAELLDTYERYVVLCKEGRNSIWGYVARNLSRPLYLSSPNRKVDVIVGNPPWLSYRFMSGDMQKQFKEAARGENIYVGGKLATHADLSGLFMARVQDLYLREGGCIAFVMPLASLTRGQFEKFRSGAFHSHYIQFQDCWTFDETVSPLFPVPSCAIFAVKGAGLAVGIPDKVTAYSGRLPHRDAEEEEADRALTVNRGVKALATASYEEGSPYRDAFRQGATLVPRVLCIVERAETGKLGGAANAPKIVSRRTNLEKKPWRDLPTLQGQIEAEFLRPVYLGESIAPFRPLSPQLAVIPVSEGKMLDAKMASNRGFPHLARWMTKAEELWIGNGTGGMSLIERWDYHGELSRQYPLRPIRVLYAGSGTSPASCLIQNQADAVIDTKLYWMGVETVEEGLFLVAVLNSEAVRVRVAPQQSRGQWGARDFHKTFFTLPIPRFDATIGLHGEIAAAGAEAVTVAASVDIPEQMKFQRARGLVRRTLADSGVSSRIDKLVVRLLGD